MSWPGLIRHALIYLAAIARELLGHSQIAITMNTYSHVVPALMKDAANQMDAALKTPEPVAAYVATKVAPKGLN